MINKKIHISALCLLVCACGTVQVETTPSADGEIKKLIYRADAPESWTSNNQKTPYADRLLTEKADSACPGGYEMLREYRKIDPPQSAHIWEVKCL